jgi:hypothetical protein
MLPTFNYNGVIIIPVSDGVTTGVVQAVLQKDGKIFGTFFFLDFAPTQYSDVQ